MWIGFFFKEFFIPMKNHEEFTQTTGNCAKYLCCQILMGISLLTNCFSRLLVRVVGLHQSMFVYQKIVCSFLLHSFSIDLYIFVWLAHQCIHVAVSDLNSTNYLGWEKLSHGEIPHKCLLQKGRKGGGSHTLCWCGLILDVSYLSHCWTLLSYVPFLFTFSQNCMP